jgi:hypothetical protein
MVWAGKRARSPTGSSPSRCLPSGTVPTRSLPTRGWAPLSASPSRLIGQSMLRKLRPSSLSRSRLHQQRPHSLPPTTPREPHPHPLLPAKRRKLHLPSIPRKLRRRLRPRPIPHTHHRHSLPPATLRSPRPVLWAIPWKRRAQSPKGLEMSSEKQVAANRTNGRKSRGPKTPSGKSAVSRNALRHGLASISCRNPGYAPRIEAIARAICPDTSNPSLFEQALIIGETTCVLGCACAERIARMERLLDATPSPPLTPTAPKKERAKREPTTALRGEREALHLATPLPLSTPGVAGIDPLDRYERKALSRRNRAVQKFMEMIARTACPKRCA